MPTWFEVGGAGHQAARQVVAGIALGTAGAYGAARLLESQLFGICGFDHRTGIMVVAVRPPPFSAFCD